MDLQQPESMVRRVAVPAFFALALPMFAGAAAVMLFAPADLSDAAIADTGTQSGQTNVSATASPVLVEPTAAPTPNVAPPEASIEAAPPPLDPTPPANIVEAEAAPLDSAPRDNVIAVEVPIGAVPVPPQGGVTLLQRRDPPPASTASVGTPIQPTFVTPAPAKTATIAPALTPKLAPATAPVTAPTAAPITAPITAKTNTAIFAPLDADAELPRNAIPREAVALAPPRSTQQPLPAFAPLSDTITVKPDTITVKPEAKSKPVIIDIKTPSRRTQTARTNTYVNMRTGPDNKETVLTVVPAKASIEVVECQSWCEVIYNGQRGWIYKGFVDRGGAASLANSQ